MRTTQEIFDVLDALAPQALAMDWDNCGLQVGSRNREVNRVLVALDPFEEVCREAEEMDAELIVTHHPLFFPSASCISEDTAQGRAASMLIRGGRTLYSCHTNLDLAKGGVNDRLAQVLGLQDVEPIGAEGLLRRGTVEPQPLEQFLGSVRNALGCPGLRYCDGGRPCARIAVGGGACGSELQEAVNSGCDTFVTADIKYNQFWDAQDLGISLIDAGHFYTENPVCAVLAHTLRRAFPELEVRISQKHRDCMKFFGKPVDFF